MCKNSSKIQVDILKRQVQFGRSWSILESVKKESWVGEQESSSFLVPSHSERARQVCFLAMHIAGGIYLFNQNSQLIGIWYSLFCPYEH